MIYSNKVEDTKSLERLKMFNRLQIDLQEEFGNPNIITVSIPPYVNSLKVFYMTTLDFQACMTSLSEYCVIS